MILAKMRRRLYHILYLTIVLVLIALPVRAEDYSAMKERVLSIAGKVSKAAGVDVKIMVIDDDSPETYVYPDRVIVLTKGFIELSKSDDEIAFAVGHEIAHINRGHYKQEVVLRILDYLAIDGEEGFVREIEADIEGINYAKKAGYNPFSAVKLLTRLPYNPSSALEERIAVIMKYLVDYPK